MDQVELCNKYKDKIADIQFYAQHLSKWEQDFLESVKGQMTRKYDISPKQQAVIDKLEIQVLERENLK